MSRIHCWFLVGLLLVACRSENSIDPFKDRATGGQEDSGLPAEPDTGDDCTEMLWYADQDGDGWGDEDRTQWSCEPPDGHVQTDGDCDDSDEQIHPEALEVCDGVDNDCDGMTDDVPVAWYPLDGDATDLTSGQNHGSVQGATPTSNRHGDPDAAMAFDGNSAHVLIPPADAITLGAEGTISVWFRVDGDSSARSQMILDRTAGSDYSLDLLDTKTLRWREHDGDTLLSLEVSMSSAVDGDWHHLAVVRTGGETTVWANGVALGSAVMTDTVMSNGLDLIVGAGGTPYDEGYELFGAMDELRFYDCALSAAAINALVVE